MKQPLPAACNWTASTGLPCWKRPTASQSPATPTQSRSASGRSAMASETTARVAESPTAEAPAFVCSPRRQPIPEISTANTNRDGTGTLGIVITGVAAGTRVAAVVAATIDPRLEWSPCVSDGDRVDMTFITTLGRRLMRDWVTHRIADEYAMTTDWDNRWRTGGTVDEVVEEGAVARSRCDAPEIDGQVFIDGATHLSPGDLVQVEIEEADEYDVWGRLIDEMSPDELRRVGRLIGRLHGVGAATHFKHRIRLTVESYCWQNIQFLRAEKLLPPSIESHYVALADRIFALAGPWLAETTVQRLHGDCHVGNILWSHNGCTLVDFDDCLEGPCVQDIWLLTPGRDESSYRSRELLLEGYEMMRDFDRSSLRLVEPLRALRMINFTTWIAKRFEDPAFKRVFVDFGSERYWREQLVALQEVGECLGVA